jgi:hypothetical protein
MTTGTVAMAGEKKERRAAMLSDADIDRIEVAFDKRLNGLFEDIGYDTTPPKSREDIRKDHAFVRDARRAKGKVIGGFLTAMGAGIATLLYAAFHIGDK